MRVFLSSLLKRRIQQDPRSLGNLAALANLNYAQLSTLDDLGPDDRTDADLVAHQRLGEVLGLSEAECFREVRRG